MIVFDGEKWTIPKYKITRAVVVYDDRPELYPDGVAEEVTLNADQISRLEEIRYNTDMSMDQVEAYVNRGEGIPPDARRDIDKLMDLLPESELYAAIDFAEQWEPDTRYLKNAYIKTGGKLYRVRQPVATLEHQPPGSTGLEAVYFPIVPAGQIADFDPTRDLSAFPFQVGELIRFPYGVYECQRITNFTPQEYAPDWVKRDDLT